MFPLALIFLLSVAQNLLGDDVLKTSGVDVSYEDLRNLNASCYPMDSCAGGRSDNSPEIKSPDSCSCDSQCSRFGTCCIDSPYRDNSLPLQKCRSTAISSFIDKGYYMVSRCPDNIDSNSVWKHLCEKKWDGEDDLLMLAPVSSSDTFTMYKNYYCFRCHETTNKFRYWDLKIFGKSLDYGFREYNLGNSEEFNVTYSEGSKTWVATAGEDSLSISMNFLVPEELPFSPITCDLDLISDCPDSWTDKDTREKCNAYTAIIYGRGGYGRKYKNFHCALCNSEHSNETSCYSYSTPYAFGHSYSFSNIMNVRKNEDEKVKCTEGTVWNPYLKMCRKIHAKKDT